MMSDDVNVTIGGNDTVSVTVGGGGGSVAFAVEQLTADGLETSFSFENNFRTGSLAVYLDGLLAKRGDTYTEKADRSGIDFIEAPAADVGIEVRYAV